eukprot:6373998-Prymnesium_polylepis.2
MCQHRSRECQILLRQRDVDAPRQPHTHTRRCLAADVAFAVIAPFASANVLVTAAAIVTRRLCIPARFATLGSAAANAAASCGVPTFVGVASCAETHHAALDQRFPEARLLAEAAHLERRSSTAQELVVRVRSYVAKGLGHAHLHDGLCARPGGHVVHDQQEQSAHVRHHRRSRRWWLRRRVQSGAPGVESPVRGCEGFWRRLGPRCKPERVETQPERGRAESGRSAQRDDCEAVADRERARRRREVSEEGVIRRLYPRGVRCEGAAHLLKRRHEWQQRAQRQQHAEPRHTEQEFAAYHALEWHAVCTATAVRGVRDAGMRRGITISGEILDIDTQKLTDRIRSKRGVRTVCVHQLV